MIYQKKKENKALSTIMTLHPMSFVPNSSIAAKLKKNSGSFDQSFNQFNKSTLKCRLMLA